MKRDLTEEQLRQEVTVVLPLSVVLRIGGEEALAQEQPARFIPASSKLPSIGSEYEGGIFAGVSLDGDQRVALVLLPGDENMPWKDAIDWAAKKGGALPSRIDQLVLFRNVKGEFKEAWYWSGEQFAGDDACAWGQDFSDGLQDDTHKANDCRVRAVRRLPIQ